MLLGCSGRAAFNLGLVRGTVWLVSPSSPDAPIQLERYAALSAEAEHAPPLAELLARESIDEATWAAAQAYWLARMADEARRQRFQTTTRYQASFERRRRALESERRAKTPSKGPAHAGPEASLRPAQSAALRASEAPAPIVEARASFDAPAPATPSAVVPPAPVAAYVHVPAQAPPVVPVPVAPHVLTPSANTQPPVHGVVVTPAQPAPPPSAQAEPARPKKAPATMVGVLLVAPAEALPFREGPAVAPAALERAQAFAPVASGQAGGGAAQKRSVDLGSTVYADPELRQAPATPFDAGPATEPTPRRKVDLGATMMPSDLVDVPAMPFAKPGPAEPRAETEARRPVAPLRASERAQAPVAGASALGTTLPPTTQPLPGAASGSAQGGGRRFSINVFASLTAEIAEHPSEVEAIRRRYGVGEAEHREESERWTAAFDADDELRQRYLGIVQRYRGYVRGQKKG